MSAALSAALRVLVSEVDPEVLVAVSRLEIVEGTSAVPLMICHSFKTLIPSVVCCSCPESDLSGTNLAQPAVEQQSTIQTAPASAYSLKAPVSVVLSPAVMDLVIETCPLRMVVILCWCGPA